MPRHVHADIIIAWAEGKEIEIRANQVLGRDHVWYPCRDPIWHERCHYRVKPDVKQVFVNVYQKQPGGYVQFGSPCRSAEEAVHMRSFLERELVSTIAVTLENGRVIHTEIIN